MRSTVFCLPEYSDGDSGKGFPEMDQESNGSSSASVEGTESPRSVVEDDEKWKVGSQKLHGHNQILRIRAEDSHLGESIGEGNLMFSLKHKLGVAHFMLFSRPILPASPLSGKTEASH